MPQNNHYSYARDEYLVKDYIDINDVLAIGIPYLNIKLHYNINVANELMNNYDINLPLVDTSFHNRSLNKEKIKVFKP